MNDTSHETRLASPVSKPNVYRWRRGLVGVVVLASAYLGLWGLTIHFGERSVERVEGDRFERHFVPIGIEASKIEGRAISASATTESPAPFVVRLETNLFLQVNGEVLGHSRCEDALYLWLFGYKTRIAGPDTDVQPPDPFY